MAILNCLLSSIHCNATLRYILRKFPGILSNYLLRTWRVYCTKRPGPSCLCLVTFYDKGKGRAWSCTDHCRCLQRVCWFNGQSWLRVCSDLRFLPTRNQEVSFNVTHDRLQNFSHRVWSRVCAPKLKTESLNKLQFSCRSHCCSFSNLFRLFPLSFFLTPVSGFLY